MKRVGCVIAMVASMLCVVGYVLFGGHPTPVLTVEQTADQLPENIALDLGNRVTMKLTLIPAGEFIMGSDDILANRPDERPKRKVQISKQFYMGIYEVTQEQYEQVMGERPSQFRGAFRPVENVSAADCEVFCRKLSARTGKTCVLPTEAQWEYACRAGTTARFSFGDSPEDLHKYGNYCDRSCSSQMAWQDKDHDDGFDETAPVGSYLPNAWGLYDMHGNVWEWCRDGYSRYENANRLDPNGPTGDTQRILRGGAWLSDDMSCRSARRYWGFPSSRDADYGFRVIIAVDKEIGDTK